MILVSNEVERKSCRLQRKLSDRHMTLSTIRELHHMNYNRFDKRSTKTSNEKNSVEHIAFESGVFKGESLSPLLFCISLLLRSVFLKTNGYCYGPPGNHVHKVAHLFYMDDSILYAISHRDIKRCLKVVQENRYGSEPENV